MKATTWKAGILLISILVIGLLSQVTLKRDSTGDPIDGASITSIGNIQTLLAKYDRWRGVYAQAIGGQNLFLPLRSVKGLSTEFTAAHGKMVLDLETGNLSVQVVGLPDAKAYDFWWVDYRPEGGSSVRPGADDRGLKLGLLHGSADGTATLETTLRPEALTGFELDLAMVVERGKRPDQGGLLYGLPNLFQRLYFNEQRGLGSVLAEADDQGEPDTMRASLWSAPFRTLVPAPAYARHKYNAQSLYGLIAKGEDLFFNQTFNGNGRTCGSCHPAENNFTIDPAFIATRPDSDPLFIAEQDPSLSTLERPELMRRFGLILENVDGFDDLENKFTMRGVPHTLALQTSLGSNLPGIKEATGWSGDGAPDGDLFSFATGAVVQHFTRCLPRPDPPVSGECFRLPHSDELVAMEAFQLSLGRAKDTNLQTLELTGSVPRLGLQVFNCVDFVDLVNGRCNDGAGGSVSQGKCNVCHVNGGATFLFAPGINANFDTGVERLTNQPPRRLDPTIPCDAGLGRDPVIPSPNPCEGVADGNGFGDGTFNTPPVIEAADTGPFFHNDSVATVEGVVAFYNSDAFNNSPVTALAGPIRLDTTEIEAVAAFLRVVNALENIRNCLHVEKQALKSLYVRPYADVSRFLTVAQAEVQDAIDDLVPANLHLDAAGELKKAASFLSKAERSWYSYNKRYWIKRAMDQQRKARDLMCRFGEVICEET